MRVLSVLIFMGISCVCGFAQAASVENFIVQARQLNLGQHPTWLALLHYKNEAILGRFVSQADDPEFFLSPDGNFDAEAELEADIQAFIKPASAGHAQCYFPARWHWLKMQLGIGSELDVACPKFERWLDSIATDRLSLVFPAMYLGNPGSTFGHTFLRFDGGDSVMLSQTVNYAAAYDPEDSMPVYVSNGLFGGYQGAFLVRPYFETVQLYSDIENRDIWEYQLDYTPEEIKQLARHTWELHGIGFDYFFFRENCSYRLLGMLDAVKSEAGLTSGNAFRLYAIPVDTVRALDERQLINNKQYRPSLASQVRRNLTQQPGIKGEYAIQLADGEIAVEDIETQVSNETDKAKIYELAYTLLQFRKHPDSELAENILKARSRVAQKAEWQYNAPVPPELGHESARFAIGGGKQNGQSYAELMVRPGFHDLVDAPMGYVEGSSINVMDMQLRWFEDDSSIELERLRFFNIVSLTPVSDWYAPPSWLLDVRLDRTRLTSTTSDIAFVARGGIGYSDRWGDMLPFAMAVLELNASDDYEDDYSLLAGAQAGVSMLLGFGQLLLIAESDDSVAGFDFLDRDSVSVELQLNLDRNIAVRAGFRQNRYKSFEDEDSFIRLQYYF